MKPILFNTEMVRAILDGRKTATRRIIKPHYRNDEYGFNVCTNKSTGEQWVEKASEDGGDFDNTRYVKPPYQPGDVLYVRETFAVGKIDCGELPDGRDVPYISQCPGENDIIPKEYAIRHGIGMDEVIWKPSIFMPKEAARIFLRVTDVRAERLQDIKEHQVILEGTPYDTEIYEMPCNIPNAGEAYLRGEFMRLWNSTIKKQDLDRYGWDANPFVWVIEFERCEKPLGGDAK